MASSIVGLPDEFADELDQPAEKLDSAWLHVADRVIEDSVALEQWQLADIEAGLAEADRGDFGTPEDLENIVGKYVNSNPPS